MNRFTIRQKHNAQNASASGGDAAPTPDPPVTLDFFPFGKSQGVQNPLVEDDRPVGREAHMVEISRALHRARAAGGANAPEISRHAQAPLYPKRAPRRREPTAARRSQTLAATAAVAHRRPQPSRSRHGNRPPCGRPRSRTAQAAASSGRGARNSSRRRRTSRKLTSRRPCSSHRCRLIAPKLRHSVSGGTAWKTGCERWQRSRL